MSTGAYSFGEVVLLPFPFTDQTASKKRPAVVVSSAAYNRARRDVVVMAVSSQFRTGLTLGEVRLDHWQVAGLLKPSVVKPVFATLAQPMIIRPLGILAAADQALLRTAIATTLH